ncbi:CLUMA_CG000712, isoform A [Clunio marinus]|uniref:CLUMA_CG000712, isoform A n=1 Tax=Clunio marinus TaxID=568069 RepID=A0A1J1HFY2_9DIPT|nr:CLUMA_CG000712, isoform A [Clunio marinus]
MTNIDIDTTGCRLTHEIVNIACLHIRCTISTTYHAFNEFESWARQDDQIRVMNAGCFRKLKSLETYKKPCANVVSWNDLKRLSSHLLLATI